MQALLGGRLGVAAYTDLASQLWFIYRELERTGRALADHPSVGPFIDPALLRTAALETDLRRLRGPAWRDETTPLPATRAYASRVAEVARCWPPGYIAHHYTRYLGDLSGGQVIRSHAERTWGFGHNADGVRFYVFDEVGNPAAVKRAYRARLDALPLDEAGRLRLAAECKLAFRLNVAVLAELSTRHLARSLSAQTVTTCPVIVARSLGRTGSVA